MARVRPYDQISALNLIIEKQKDWSFPSGHTGSSFACAWAIFRNAPKEIWGTDINPCNINCTFTIICRSSFSE